MTSECAGAGTAPKERAQVARLVLETDSELATGPMAKFGVPSWRSSRRMVSSTLAGETLFLTQGVAELEWMQTLYRHVQFGDVTAPGCDAKLEPYSIALNQTSEIASRQPSLPLVDAKIVFDTSMDQTGGSKHDRRTAVDLSLLHRPTS